MHALNLAHARAQMWDCMLMATLHRMPQLRRLYVFGDMRGGLTPVAPVGLRCANLLACCCCLLADVSDSQ